jgi:hypothetical protein
MASNTTIFLNILLVAAVLFTAYNLYRALTQGKILAKGGREVDRSKSPFLFWFSFVFYSALGIFTLALLIMSLTGVIRF